MRKQFKQTICEIAAHDSRVVLVFGDISVFLFNDFRQHHPRQFFNIGICENTMVSVAAGLRSQGFIPVVHSIAPFVTERSFEQIKIDLCYNGFPATIVSLGASFDYAWDGPTHHAVADLAMLRLLPDIHILQPGSPKECDALLRSQYQSDTTHYFRLSDYPHTVPLETIALGKGIVLRDTGATTTVVTAGPILENVMQACADLNVNLLYFHTLKPFDHELINRYGGTRLKVVHDARGLFEAVCETAGRSVECLMPPDAFSCGYGTFQDARRAAGLDPAAIRSFVKA